MSTYKHFDPIRTRRSVSVVKEYRVELKISYNLENSSSCSLLLTNVFPKINSLLNENNSLVHQSPASRACKYEFFNVGFTLAWSHERDITKYNFDVSKIVSLVVYMNSTTGYERYEWMKSKEVQSTRSRHRLSQVRGMIV